MTKRQPLPEMQNVDTTPQCLDLGSRAMWVLGWNECVEAMQALQTRKQELTTGGGQ